MADEIRIEIKGISDVIGAIDDLKARLDRATRAATQDAGEALVTNASLNFGHPPAPMTRSGNLQRSIRLDPVVGGAGRYSTTVGPRAAYARIQELGGTIYPKRASMLSWVGPDGKRVFAHKVTLPARPYFTPAYFKTRGQMNTIFESAWGAAIDG